MRGRRWIVGGGLIVAAVAAYVVLRPQEPEPALPPVPLVEAGEPTVVQPVVAAPVVAAAPVPVAVDAAVEDAGGAPEPEVDVEIEVVRGAERLVGVRVTLEGPGGEVGRPTDVMGVARLSLRPGRWMVKAPDLRETTQLDIRAEVSRYTVRVLYERFVSGIVRDDSGAPVAFAAVRRVARGMHEHPGMTSQVLSRVVREKRIVLAGLAATTGTDGTFSFSTMDPELEIEAIGLLPDGQEFRSLSRKVSAPASGVTLVLTRWGKARVTFVPEVDPVFVLAQSMYGDTAARLDERSPVIRLPVGRVDLTAQAISYRSVCTARGEVLVRPETTEQVTLNAVCAGGIRGRVVDTFGKPVAGVAVDIRCNPGAAPSPPGARPVLSQGLEVTDSDGRFTYSPDQLMGVEQLCEVALGEPWWPTRDALVKVGDQPITIVAADVHSHEAAEARRARLRPVAPSAADAGLPAGTAASDAPRR